ncbi:MAG: hypothetical protein IKO26_00090 [Paludibacteraceae bacterium]|nr:hypothetical protein [Paludibacteraceae bacterium]
MKEDENKKITGADSTNLEVKQKRPVLTETFDFIRSFVEHIKSIFRKFSNTLPSSNEEYIALGRSKKEKEQIAEMCRNIDEETNLLIDLRKSNLTPESWLRNTTEEILQDCTDEEREIVIQAVEEEERIIVESLVDSLGKTVNEEQKNQNKQTEAES